MLGGYLVKQGYAVTPVASGQEALEVITGRTIDIMITDQKMPHMSGIELASRVCIEHPNVSVIMLTAHGSIDDAVRAMKDGVEDYLTKPVNLEELDIILQRVIEKRHLVRENRELKNKTVSIPHIKGIIYISPVMEEVMSRAVRAAASTATVLIGGESGTGKELVAQAIHYLSDRNSKPFVPVNCSAIPENLIESELFGHEKGAFTGADQRRIGRFEQADGGTLFLDEIGDLPLSAQVKLLRVLQERTFERVGGNQVIHVDVRVISATNRNLEIETSTGRFRQDLFYRLHVIGIELPPLRERKIDIPPLVEYFRKLYADQHGKTIRAVTPEALDILVKYSFPGNIRELSNLIEQAVVLTRNDIITVKDLPVAVIPSEAIDEHEGSLDDQVETLERNAVSNALRQTDDNKSAAARLLGISERKIRYLIQKYNI
jgi:DNA-binding NtrC family response regulator